VAGAGASGSARTHAGGGGRALPRVGLLDVLLGGAAPTFAEFGAELTQVPYTCREAFGDVDLLFAAGKQRLVPEDHPLISAARALGTSFGDGVPHSHYPDPKPAVVV
jgi:hypothetical protein